MKALLRKIRQILRDRRTRQMLTRIISVTAAIVVFVTTYALVLPAITMEAEAQCGIEAHQHNDSCYSEVLICELEESDGHHHDESCYSTSTVLVCETEEHQHSVDNGCYDEDGNLICEKIEHVHDEDCYEEARELICEIAESEGHQHDESCYQKVLTCGKEVHTHSTACYRDDAASTAATEAAAVASTASTASGSSTASTASTANTASGGVDYKFDDASTASTNAVSVDNSGESSTAASTGATTATAGYVPVLDELNFNTVLDDHTGIYYSHPAAVENNGAATDNEPATVDNSNTAAVEWNRIDKHTELGESDLLRVYLAYTIPAGSLNETNTVARYRMPGNVRLTDEQVEQINSTVNGIAGQYVSMDTLEILDQEMYSRYLGIEAVEGIRTPSDDLNEYLAKNGGQEFISATVKVEDVVNEHTGEYEGQDLVFTFVPYTVLKNQHEYDADGQPTKAGEEVSGWVSFYITTDAVEWIEDGDDEQTAEKTAEVVFVEKDKELGLKEISTKLKLVDKTAVDDEDDSSESSTGEKAEAVSEDTTIGSTDDAAADATVDDHTVDNEGGSQDSTEDAAEASTEEVTKEVNYPAISFDDSITVSAGTLSTDTTVGNGDTASAVTEDTEITVHVEADEDTFPEGTTMVLAAVSDMDAVAEAVEGAMAEAVSEDDTDADVDGEETVDNGSSEQSGQTGTAGQTGKRTMGFHALDISFQDAEGNEIEPLKPIRVSMSSEAIRMAVEDETTAPVVVHIADPSSSSDGASNGATEDEARDAAVVDTTVYDDAVSGDATVSVEAGEEHAVDNEDSRAADVADNSTTDAADSVHTVDDETTVDDDHTVDNDEAGEANTGDAATTAEIVESATEMSDGSSTVEAGDSGDAEEAKDDNSGADATGSVTFESDEFSVYAIVYTVDFHWTVDGKEYSYSITGGSAITLSELLPTVGIVSDDENTEVDEVKAFLADVESVEFSNPELVYVEKAEVDTTVGAIEDNRGLDIQYSAEVDDVVKEEIRGKIVSSGDWALISVQPFTSEETLTVRMKNGDQFVVKVTDAHEIISSESSNIDINKAYMICYDDGENYHILNNDGSETTISKSAFSFLAEYYTSEQTWAFQYVFTEYDREGTEGYNYYLIRSNDDISKTLAIYEEVNDSEQLVQSSNNNVALLPAEGGGFYISGYNGYRLAYENGKFIAKKYNEGDADTGSVMHLFERDSLPQYMLTVSSNDPEMGVVWCYNPTSSETDDQIPIDYDFYLDGHKVNEWYKQFEVMSDSGATRHIDQELYALPWGEQGKNGTYRYKFDHWELNGESLDPDDYPWRIEANTLPVPYNGSNLVAHFVYDDTFEAYDSQKTDSYVEDMSNWLSDFTARRVPLDETATSKTAEVYDYENRIYRVDLTTKSNLRTFNGNLDLGFSLDVSNSMKFPADLQPYSNLNNVDIRAVNGGFQEGYNYHSTINLPYNNGKQNGTYYLISDAKNRSTVFRIQWRNNQWEWKDASADDSKYKKIDSTTKFHAVSDGNYDNNYTYQLYYANPDSTGVIRDRFYYLNQSINSITDDLVNIKNTLNVAGASSPKVKVGYNTFNGYVQKGQYEGGSWQKNDRRTLTDVSPITPAFENVAGGGTRPDRAIEDAKSLGWTGNTRYLILITDGAPQGGGGGTNPDETAAIRQEVRDKADEIRASTGQNVKIITIGLSMKDVEQGRILLYDIADYAPNNGPKMFYLAEKTQDLTNILRQILDLILEDATVVGDITDTVNEAFYLVDKATGLPLEPNDTIDIDGNKTSDPAKVAGTVQPDGKTVKWDDQIIDSKNGWHGVAYVKAKEDLIGANAAKTNDTNNPVEFLAEKYYTSKDPTRKTFSTNETNKLKTRVLYEESPRVNVNELSFPDTSTEWTVYLGTQVDPKKQLQRLYEEILVEEVVNDNGSLHYPLSENNISDERDNDIVGTAQTFKLAPVILELIKADSTLNAKYIKNNELNWDAFLTDILAEDGIAVPYHLYGIEGEDSRIVISLKKEILMGEETDVVAKSPHNTTVVNTTGEDDNGDPIDIPAEKYLLTVKYFPDYDHVLPKGQGGTNTGNFHTGAYGTGYQGHAAGTETSRNNHIINVIAKDIGLIKVSTTDATHPISGMTLNTDTDEYEASSGQATFALYRSATSQELVDYQEALTDEPGLAPEDFNPPLLSITGKSGSYVLVGTFSTDQNGEIKFVDEDDVTVIKALSNATVDGKNETSTYYLVETKAPDGYNLMDEVLEVQLEVTNRYDTFPADVTANQNVDKDTTKLQNWTQTVTGLKIVGQSGAYNSAYVDSTPATNTEKIVKYKVRNTPGVELPSTGGPGTKLIYLIGLILAALSGAGLVIRRSQRRLDRDAA